MAADGIKALYSLKGKRIWIAGHNGMVGAAVMRRLREEDCTVLTVPRAQLDLTRQDDVRRWLEENRPDAVILAAAYVGGILANKESPADFLYKNLMIAGNVIHAAARQALRSWCFWALPAFIRAMLPSL